MPLVRPLLRARHRGKVRQRLSPAIQLNSRVADLVGAGEANDGARGAAVVVAGDVEVGTLNVPLLLAVGRVHAHLLDAHQVLAGRDLSVQLELKVLLLICESAVVLAVPGHARAELVHLEPAARAVVVTHVAGRLGEADLKQFPSFRATALNLTEYLS